MITVLTIAGSDSGGGAGIQADLHAITDHGLHGASAITAITAQHTRGVTRIDPVPVEGVLAQIEAVRDDLDVAAIKIGMLGGVDHVLAVASALADWTDRPPVVLDPVMVATSGDRLLDEAAVDALVGALVPLSTVVTPNVPEAAILAGVDGPVAEVAAALAGPRDVLLTGGDDPDTPDTVVDRWVRRDGQVVAFTGGRVAGGPFHGTGCTLSSALAARLARGEDLEIAIPGAIAYVRMRLETAWAVGRGSRVGGTLGAWV